MSKSKKHRRRNYKKPEISDLQAILEEEKEAAQGEDDTEGADTYIENPIENSAEDPVTETAD